MCPSYSEGMPNVILEAMSRGLAIIATDVGAVNLLVSENNGTLLKYCNTNLIEKSLIKFLKMKKNSILKMKKNSIQIVRKKFTWDKVMNRFIEIINI